VDVSMVPRFGNDLKKPRSKKGEEKKGVHFSLLQKIKLRGQTILEKSIELNAITSQYMKLITSQKDAKKNRARSNSKVPVVSNIVLPDNSTIDGQIDATVKTLKDLLITKSKANPPTEPRMLVLQSLPKSKFYNFAGVDMLVEGMKLNPASNIFNTLFHASNGVDISTMTKEPNQNKKKSKSAIFMKELRK
jgi:hypothetical protein